MGGEFLPKLGEGAIVGTTVRLAGISVDEAVAQNDRIERVLMAEFPDEIEHIWTRLGTAEVATDPMGVELADFFLALKPRKQWKKARTQPELTEMMRDVLNQVPGLKPAFSQAIEMRLNELIAGIRGDIGIKVYGDDLEELRRLGGEVQQVLAGIRGASEASVEELTGQTFTASGGVTLSLADTAISSGAWIKVAVTAAPSGTPKSVNATLIFHY